MPREHLILTLAKVLIAAAWADGELTHDEINSMKDLLYGLPELTARQWASLQIYIETPVSPQERARLVENLRRTIRTPADRALALRTLDDMMHADGAATEAEEAVLTQIKAAVEAVDVGLLAQLVKGMTARRSQTVAGAPNREDDIEEYVKNKVYYGVRQRLAMLDVLFAIAAADGQASYDEIEEIRAMARSLKVSHQDFIQAKLTLPRAKRAQ